MTTVSKRCSSIIPGFVPAYIRPLFCEAKRAIPLVALSGDPEDIYRTDEAIPDLFPDGTAAALDLHGVKQVEFSGLPPRSGWLGYGDRAKQGWFNELVVRPVSLAQPIGD